MELEKLTQIICEIAGVHPEEITLATSFIEDLGLDSLDVFQIVTGIEQEFDIEITAEQAEAVVTIEDAVNLIKETVG
jgi:acyl carrier protein